MTGIEYAYFMCGLVGLVVIVKLVTFDAKDWISRGLRRGDLYALVDVASGLRPDGLTRDQASRLQARGMAREYGNGYFRATIKGRLALLIRQAVRQTVQS
jgi:hypothetical protein